MSISIPFIGNSGRKVSPGIAPPGSHGTYRVRKPSSFDTPDSSGLNPSFNDEAQFRNRLGDIGEVEQNNNKGILREGSGSSNLLERAQALNLNGNVVNGNVTSDSGSPKSKSKVMRADSKSKLLSSNESCSSSSSNINIISKSALSLIIKGSPEKSKETVTKTSSKSSKNGSAPTTPTPEKSVHPPFVTRTLSRSISSSWPNSKEDYELKDMIGMGATAIVHEAVCIPRNNEKCAIKRINLDRLNVPLEELKKEILAMSSCNHENVVNYYTSFVVKEELWIVLRLLEGGSLLDIIKHRTKTVDCKLGVFDEVFIATVLKEVLKGLEYFHANGLIHRDIKAGNILVGEDGTVQIADFGVSTWVSNADEQFNRRQVRHTFVGTPCWMAPEVMQSGKGYDFKADIWSVGITAIEMVRGSAPYHIHPPMKILMLTIQNDSPSIDTELEDKDKYKNYGKTIRKFIAECLQKDPAKRPTASELLKHPFFKKAKDKTFVQTTIGSLERPVRNIQAKKAPRASRNRKASHGDWDWTSSGSEGSHSNDDSAATITTSSNTSGSIPESPEK
ncbi:unnamed protein product [Allacma fusca]|uniref:non-specific serine/threonine protein kinase n=1 Tax=Allacma fusca TaxID=39272 RepID=A0A8J2LID5_9HEXA|nr:unnamed protein product [Allacma fusca]